MSNLLPGLSLKALLENPELLTMRMPKPETSKEKKLEDTVSDGVYNRQQAFLGPVLWDETLPYNEKDLMFEYMDLDEFLEENGIPQTGGQGQGQQRMMQQRMMQQRQHVGNRNSTSPSNSNQGNQMHKPCDSVGSHNRIYQPDQEMNRRTSFEGSPIAVQKHTAHMVPENTHMTHGGHMSPETRHMSGGHMSPENRHMSGGHMAPENRHMSGGHMAPETRQMSGGHMSPETRPIMSNNGHMSPETRQMPGEHMSQETRPMMSGGHMSPENRHMSPEIRHMSSGHSSPADSNHMHIEQKPLLPDATGHMTPNHMPSATLCYDSDTCDDVIIHETSVGIVEIPPQDIALASIPGKEEFNPVKRKFADEELRPQPMIKRSKKLFVPCDMKDDRYWCRRKKNNVAAKRSRDARRIKENQIGLRAAFLEKENELLHQETEKLQQENDELKHKLAKLTSNY